MVAFAIDPSSPAAWGIGDSGSRKGKILLLTTYTFVNLSNRHSPF